MRVFRFRGKEWVFGGRPYVLAIMNITPDSFSDGGPQNHDPAYQIERAGRLLEEGADGLDLGAESTRPGHQPVEAEEEWNRLGPVLRAVRRAYPQVPLSVDTYKAEVARRALEEGADIINDIWGFSRDAAMAEIVARYRAGAVLMFNSEENPEEPVAPADVRTFLMNAVSRARDAGMAPDQVVVDPGVGFRVQGDSIGTILAHLDALSGLGAGILVGHSRKRFLGAATGIADPRERDVATAVLSGLLAEAGADILRVHNPKATRQALAVHEWWRTFYGSH
ncbi:MAG: dihydropteroate synthase [Firmicutes bacterium]|nr:dihydropteroate synthase [Bacillota bacterium]